MLEPGNHGSQANNILAHLLEGHSITPLDALQQYGCFRLAPVIHVLRKQGYSISTSMISSKRGTSFASYKLDKNTPMQ